MKKKQAALKELLQKCIDMKQQQWETRPWGIKKDKILKLGWFTT